MTEFDYEVLTTDNPGDITLLEAADLLAAEYPDHHVVVEEQGNQLVATLARKDRISRRVVAADDDALGLLDEAPMPPKKKGPPEGSPEEEAGETPDEEAKEDAPEDLEDKEKDKKEDKGEGKGDDLSKAIDALKTLEKVLPKLKDLLGGGDLGLHDDLGGPPGEHVPPDEGLGPMGDIGPTPGAPPSSAGKPPMGLPGGGGPAGLGGPPAPHMPPATKPDMRHKPAIGVPAFSNNRRSKVVYRPINNEDGTIVSMAQAMDEISNHPRYSAYEVQGVKRDGEQYAAHLILKEG